MQKPEEMSQFAKDLLEGLNNALAHARGEPAPGTIEHVIMVPHVKAIRRPDPPSSPNPPASNRH
jgi:hypothetical protein